MFEIFQEELRKISLKMAREMFCSSFILMNREQMMIKVDIVIVKGIKLTLMRGCFYPLSRTYAII